MKYRRPRFIQSTDRQFSTIQTTRCDLEVHEINSYFQKGPRGWVQKVFGLQPLTLKKNYLQSLIINFDQNEL